MKDAMKSRLARRRSKALAAAVKAAKVDCLLVSRPEDVSYLSGFTGEDSYLLLGKGGACLLTDGRFDEQARKECPGVAIIARKGPLAAAVAEHAAARRYRRIGIQADHMTVAGSEALAKAVAGRKVQPVGEILLPLRAVKDAGEVAAIRQAVAAAQEAFLGLIAGGARNLVGRTEREVAAELDFRMRLAGAEGPSFETIVAAGAHGSLPHYRPGGTRLSLGQAVLIDWGARLSGYCSDLTRVVFLGRIPPKLASVYDVVERAQQAGIAAVAGGAPAADADIAARKVIDDAGYGCYFVHALGHGVGRAIHESPALSRLAKVKLTPGMVVTVEPGIYLPGIGGVRIEDDVLVTSGGRRKLSSLPTAAAAMVLK
jgi:Xaa-Pro aminopeptidase